MRPELQQELERLKKILEANGKDFLPVEPVAPTALAEIERETGISLDPDLRDFFAFSNGSGGEIWAAARTDRLVPLCFPLLEEAHQQWALFEPYDDAVYEEWNVADDDDRDPRIQPAYTRHRLWFPVGECDGYCVTLYYDADPTAKGKPGQLLVYQCDSETVHYAAGSFLEFLRQSNDLLEAHGEELFYPEDPDLALDGDGEVPEELRAELKQVLAHIRQAEVQNGGGPSLAETAAVYGYSDASTFLFGHEEGLRIAMDVAVMNNQPEVVACLVAEGASVNLRDEFGDTPLITAAGCGHEETVRILLEHGADAQARNEEGQTALDKARAKNHAGIVRLLEQAASGQLAGARG